MTPPNAHALSLNNPQRASIGLAGLAAPPPPVGDQVLGYQVTASSAATLAERSRRDKRNAAIAGAVGVSVGGTLMLSASSRDAAIAGGAILGLGATFVGLAIVNYLREKDYIDVRDAYAKSLMASGHPTPGVPEILMDKGPAK